MIFYGSKLNEYLMQDIPDVKSLTLAFGFLFFLMATQDIAVDGWALTMLSEANRPHASTCNGIGQTLGNFTAYIVFIAFTDANFCNRWFRSEPQETGMLDLAS